MLVVNKEMYHFHRKNKYDNMWQEGNEITVDNNFVNSYKYKQNINTSCICENGIFPLYYIIEQMLEKIETKEQLLILNNMTEEGFFNEINSLYAVLDSSKKLIHNVTIKKREEILEKVRKEKYSDLPSRYNCIWVCGEEQLEFWNKKIGYDTTLYKLLLTGKIFKTNSVFLKQVENSVENPRKYAEKYWNPELGEEVPDFSSEYLFQGNVKILKKIK